ncbi:MAG: gliding motility-associated C-terminal domain-containing protein [Flavobacteriales bacterium]
MKQLTLLFAVFSTQFLSAQNLIENGDFELLNLGITSQYFSDCNSKATWAPFNPIVKEKFYCVCDSTGTFTGFAGWQNCKDHTPDNGKKMMVVNGATTANEQIWCQQITGLKKNTYYKFSTYVSSIIAANPAKLQFSINNDLLGKPFDANATTCSWNQFYELWDSKEQTSANICIVNQNTVSNGNDFALDDITFIEVGLTMPNVFTPNGDSHNDTYHPFTFKEISKYAFVIYDRWGVKVYEQTEDIVTKQPEWNGKMNGDGSDCAPGTYFWVLNYETSIQDISAASTITGNVTLIR